MFGKIPGILRFEFRNAAADFLFQEITAVFIPGQMLDDFWYRKPVAIYDIMIPGKLAGEFIQMGKDRGFESP